MLFQSRSHPTKKNISEEAQRSNICCAGVIAQSAADGFDCGNQTGSSESDRGHGRDWRQCYLEYKAWK